MKLILEYEEFINDKEFRRSLIEKLLEIQNSPRVEILQKYGGDSLKVPITSIVRTKEGGSILSGLFPLDSSDDYIWSATLVALSIIHYGENFTPIFYDFFTEMSPSFSHWNSGGREDCYRNINWISVK